jgi:hypothetical protein
MNRICKSMSLLIVGSGFVLSAGLFTGCKSAPTAAATPVQATNPDGSITNPDGSVTIPAKTTSAANPTMAIRNQDGSISNPDGSVTYPAGSRVAKREENPREPAPVSRESNERQPYRNPNTGPAPVAATHYAAVAPAGTIVSVRVTQSLSASRNQVGDRFDGVLDAPITSQGGTIFPAGTPVAGEVVSARGRGRFKGAGDLGISLTSIGRDQVETNVYERNAPGKGKQTAGFIGGGAGLGALIGGLAGGGKGALIGGLSGAAAGTATDAYVGNHDVVIPSETRVTFRLTQDLRR